jgi:uncharacterized lipoprotein YehR (DUF1307 family)
MKRKIFLSLLVIVALFIITGCGSDDSEPSKEYSNTFKINDLSLVFDQDSEFHDFKYKNIKGLEPDESKQAAYLDYKNNDIYDGRFVFRISMSFTNELTLQEFLEGYKTETVKINGISWERLTLSNKADNKDTSSVVYATEKNSTVYAVSTMAFKEANVDINELSNIFINGVTLK